MKSFKPEFTNVEKNTQSMFITTPKQNRIINDMVRKSKKLTIQQIYKKFKKDFISRFL